MEFLITYQDIFKEYGLDALEPTYLQDEDDMIVIPKLRSKMTNAAWFALSIQKRVTITDLFLQYISNSSIATVVDIYPISIN